MIKISYIISDINKAVAFEWIAEALDKEKFDISFIILNPFKANLEIYLRSAGFTVYHIQCRGKRDWPQASYSTYKLLREIRPQVVHCHLLQANIIGLISARMAGIKKRIYTRHHSSLHHVYFRKGIWWDRLANVLATDIIAISGVVKQILVEWEKADERKVISIAHGFKLEAFHNIEIQAVEAFKKRYDIEGQGPVIGVISRFTIWKGIQYIIPAFQKLLLTHPGAVLLLLNAQGDYEHHILKQLKAIPASSYRIIKFETDIAAAYKSMDIFVHVPIDEHSEAFGQIYVEALASKVPSIFTMSGIAPDFVVDRENALVVAHKDSDKIHQAILELTQDADLKVKLKENGHKCVQEKFALHVMIQKLEDLYARE